ncbi:MAG: diaminopimelate epimerase [Actinobacteria bacterium]|nr:MAG: diaminopimelate epimerase [Actinomycetota bacterium]
MTDALRFSKYQASGNDFVIIDELEGPAPEVDVPALCDRWVGAGADGVIRARPGAAASFRFDLTNADGSSAEMSGNGMRCLAAYLRERGRLDVDEVDVETPAGLRHVTVHLDGARVTRATVEMGTPNFTKAAIPMFGPAWETFLEQPFDIGGGLTFPASALSMGNPHLVVFVDEDPDRYHLEHIGPALEHHELFPERTNVELVRVADGDVRVRVWERGVGETLACGTGACAVAVATNEAGLIPPTAIVSFRGGPLRVERCEDGRVLLEGPVAHVYDGVADPLELR